MKILVVSHSCVIEANQRLLAMLPEVSDVKMHLLTPAAWVDEYTGKRWKTRLAEPLNFSVSRLPTAFPGHISLHFYTRLPWKALRAFAPEVLLSAQEPWSLSGLQAAALARVLRCPLVFQTNQNIVKHLPPPFSQIERFSYRRASLALAYSEEARQVMLTKGLRAPARVVPYATDLTRFAPGRGGVRREKLGLTQNCVVGYLGRFVPEKGLETLIEAVQIARRARPELHLLMVGSGPQEDALKARAREKKIEANVTFAGVVPHDEAGEWMATLDMFALPSRTTARWKEQFGRVILEAMACAVPVIGSDSGQIPTLIAATGGGLIFREGDAADLAAKIVTLAEDSELRRRLGQAGADAARREYGADAVARQLTDACAAAIRAFGKTA